MRLFIKNLLIEMRVWQWAKNALIFVPFIFGGSASNLSLLRFSLMMFLSFCAASSFVYILNDIFDRESDRLHPSKCERPIAKGTIGLNAGILTASVLLATAIISSYFVSIPALLIIIGYVLLNIAYSGLLKHVVIVDLLLVSIMYLLRVFAGGVAIMVPVSGWLLLTTLFASLFLIVGKRGAEFRTSITTNIKTRKVLNKYNEKFLDGVLLLSLSLFVFSYSLYSVTNHNNLFSFSILIVLYGALRYLYLIFARGLGEEPEKLIFKDKPLLLSGFLFVIFIITMRYFEENSFSFLM